MMAASMVCRKSLLNIRNFCSKRCQFRRYYDERKNSTTGAYFIFIPEVPKDTRETNPLMRYDEHPQLTDVTSNQVVRACAKLGQEFESKFDKLMEELTETPRELSFSELFDYIEQYLTPLQYAEHQAKILTMADTQNHPKHILDRITNQINRIKNDRFVHSEFQDQLKTLDKKRSELTEYQQRLLDLNLLECKLAGSELNNEQLNLLMGHLNDILAKEKELMYKTVYHKNLFTLSLGANDWTFVKNLPHHVLLSIAEDKHQPDRGPWKLNLLGYVYDSFLEICPRRDYRFKVWNARHTVGTIMTTDIRLHTFEIIDDIRDSRKDIAQLLGYEHYAALSLETKMAKDVNTVLTMLDTYNNYFLPEATSELEELQEFANTQGFRESIKQWDIPYFRRLQARLKYKVEKIDRHGYFSFDKVINTLLNLCETLFQIKFERVTTTTECGAWHPDVLVFDVFNSDGSYVSRFYLDPIERRESKMRTTSAELGRERSDLMGMTPISFIMLNLSGVYQKDSPVLVSYQEVLQIFHQFGTSLQQMLTTVPYSELSGQRNVEGDCIHMCGYMMRMFAKQPWVIKAMSKHHQTEEQLADGVIDRLIKCQTNLSAYDMCHELYKSAFDIDCHLAHKEKYWKDIQEEVYKLFMPLELHVEDWIWCSDTTLWIGKSHAAGYYQYIWSEMLAANVFEEFESTMGNENQLSKVGQRFRDSFFSLGGAVPAKLVFRQFTGRDPSFTSLITRHKAQKETLKTLPVTEQKTLA